MAFSSELANVLNTLECYITLGQEGLPETHTPAYLDHFLSNYGNKVFSMFVFTTIPFFIDPVSYILGKFPTRKLSSLC